MSQETKRSYFTLRTSDRRVFRRCLRKWDYISSMRQNLTRIGPEQNINFWFGSAIHFALEDFHGWNQYGDPRKAFYAYYHAFKDDERPIQAESVYNLGFAMLSYYLTWYAKHNMATQFETVWFDKDYNEVAPFTTGAQPAVEQKFMIPLNVQVIVDIKTDKIYAKYIPGSENMRKAYGDLGQLIKQNADIHVFKLEETIVDEEFQYIWIDSESRSHAVKIVPIYYHGTIDRIVKDKYGRWWLVDYKTAKGADTNKLDTDDQIDAYLWAACQLYKRPIYGFIYLQLTKDVVQKPRRLKNGELSVDKRQKTTYSLFKMELLNDYGDVRNAPNKLIIFLNELASRESPEGDKFIRWDFIKRSDQQIINTAKAIYAELDWMLSPNLYCFPNPTRDCIWDCPVREACIAQNRNDTEALVSFLKDWEERPRDEDGNIDPWRKHLPPASEIKLLELEDILDITQNMTIELDSNTEETGFQFLYDYDDDRG